MTPEDEPPSPSNARIQMDGLRIQMDGLRIQMVKEQIEMRGIHDRRVLGAMRTVPRHRFVPAKYLYGGSDGRSAGPDRQ